MTLLVEVVVSVLASRDPVLTSVEEVAASGARLVDSLPAELVGSGAGGGMTLKLIVALHSAREWPFGQQPALVQ